MIAVRILSRLPVREPASFHKIYPTFLRGAGTHFAPRALYGRLTFSQPAI